MSYAEFNALTPRELQAELKAATKRDERENAREDRLLKLLDMHFATAHTIAHNAHFRRSAQFDDYRLLSEAKQHFTPQQLAIDAKLRADAQARIRAKRAAAKI